jgi:hypothetical protein
MTRRRREAPLVSVSPAARPARALRVPGSPASRRAPALGVPGSPDAPTLDVRLHLPWPVLDLLRDLALPLLVISISFSVVAWVLAFRISCLPAPDAIAAGIGGGQHGRRHRDHMQRQKRLSHGRVEQPAEPLDSIDVVVRGIAKHLHQLAPQLPKLIPGAGPGGGLYGGVDGGERREERLPPAERHHHCAFGLAAGNRCALANDRRGYGAGL